MRAGICHSITVRQGLNRISPNVSQVVRIQYSKRDENRLVRDDVRPRLPISIEYGRTGLLPMQRAIWAKKLDAAKSGMVIGAARKMLASLIVTFAVIGLVEFWINTPFAPCFSASLQRMRLKIIIPLGKVAVHSKGIAFSH
jgi:hypothetical protein